MKFARKVTQEGRPFFLMVHFGSPHDPYSAKPDDVAAMFASMAHVSFLVLHVVTMWSIAELMKREVATAAAARRRSYHVMHGACVPPR